MYPQAIAECEKIPREALAVSSENQFVALTVAWVYAVAGHKAEAEKMLEGFLRLSPHDYLDAYLVGAVYYGLGDDNQCLQWLEKAYQQRSATLIGLHHDVLWYGRIPSNPRYQELLRRVGLTP